MSALPSLYDLLATAKDSVKPAQDRISEILARAEVQSLSDAQTKELITETVKIEAAAIDIFAVFEARNQHHFRRGPFSRKLKTALLAAGHVELADRLHLHYLAINVLKHGTGASYRELQKANNARFLIKSAHAQEIAQPEERTGLIDVTEPHFFDGLAKTIQEATAFLEGK